VTKLNPQGAAVVYSTYIGGNNGGGEFASAITVDSGGNAYITGLAGAGFPVTTGAYQTALAGFYAAFVTKLNAAGTALVYSTYVGGGSDMTRASESPSIVLEMLTSWA
jgi:hypothetical protein